MEYYNQYANALPEVCDAGKKCRNDIRVNVRQEVMSQWESAITAVKNTLAATIAVSQHKFKQAYEDAFFCDHGCQCQFIEKQYTELNNAINEKLGLISRLEVEIDMWEGEIAAWESTDCDFTVLRLEAEAEWATKE